MKLDETIAAALTGKGQIILADCLKPTARPLREP